MVPSNERLERIVMDTLLVSFESLDTRVNPFIRVQPVLLHDVRTTSSKATTQLRTFPRNRRKLSYTMVRAIRIDVSVV